MTWWRDLALGARLAVSGGRGGLARTVLTAVGVGLGVALLLVAASVPHMYHEREVRTHARDDLQFTGAPKRAAADTLLIGFADTDYRDEHVRGRALQAEGPDAPVPPGVRAVPAPGTMVVSPRLRVLLRAHASLRARLRYRVAGTIARRGLAGPGEAAFYAGEDRLVAGSRVSRIDRFGSPVQNDGFDPVLSLLAIIVLVALLVPVAVFLAASVRFGGERRDRRLAALRLAGADRFMLRRIAAGEAALGAVAGLAVGVALFGVARGLVSRVRLQDLSVYPADVAPAPVLLLLVLLGIPALAVGVGLIALRGVEVDALGVVRRAQPRRRRLLWRLAFPAAGAALLVPLLGVDVSAGESFDEWQVAGGVTLLLIGLTALLPWTVEAVVHRLQPGGVAGQLAVRRLQADNGTSARVVSGIAVAVAGAVTLQTVFSGVQGQYEKPTGVAPDRHAQVILAGTTGIPSAAAVDRRLAVRGATQRITRAEYPLTTDRVGDTSLTVAGCRTLARMLVLRACRDGDAFVTPDRATAPRAGDRARVGGRAFTVPGDLRTARPRALPSGSIQYGLGLLATPRALAGIDLGPPRIVADVTVDRAAPGTLERLRGVAARMSPVAEVAVLDAQTTDADFAVIRRGLYAGATLVLLLIAASMAVSTLEQVRERRRVLAALVAFGTPRRVLSRSVLLQAALPVALGVGLAMLLGTGLGALLLTLVSAPVQLDVAAIAGMGAIGAAVVPLVTAVTLPALRRAMTPEGLRAE